MIVTKDIWDKLMKLNEESNKLESNKTMEQILRVDI